MVRSVISLVVVLAVGGGCVYSQGNLARGPHGYRNYPSTLEAEHARRTKRRRRALIAAPIEIVGGLALAALAIYAPSKPSESSSVTGTLADAGKELLGRLLLAAAGGAVAMSGVGDGVLGLIDPAFPSPLVRGGRLVPADEIETIAPPRGPRPGFHTTSLITSRGVGVGLGFGLAHWVRPTLRLRHVIESQLILPFHSSDRSLLITGELNLERAFGRVGAGLYPRRSIGIYALGGYGAVEDREDGALVGGGIAVTVRGLSYRLGTSIMLGVEPRPSLELGLRREIRVD